MVADTMRVSAALRVMTWPKAVWVLSANYASQKIRRRPGAGSVMVWQSSYETQAVLPDPFNQET
jgi:hypothetical protein